MQKNEAPCRKRTGYQSGKDLILLGGTHRFPPNPSSACLPHRKRMGYSKEHNKGALLFDLIFHNKLPGILNKELILIEVKTVDTCYIFEHLTSPKIL